MPIKRELRWFYPIDWPEISRRVRFERAGGVCQGCGRPHGETVRCLPDGRWFDPARQTWRNQRGRPARWPDIEEAIEFRQTRVILAAAHLDHDPTNSRLRNLKSLCQRCHMIHDWKHHMARRRITYLLRQAMGDLFLGPYPVRGEPMLLEGPSRDAPQVPIIRLLNGKPTWRRVRMAAEAKYLETAKAPP